MSPLFKDYIGHRNTLDSRTIPLEYQGLGTYIKVCKRTGTAISISVNPISPDVVS